MFQMQYRVKRRSLNQNFPEKLSNICNNCPEETACVKEENVCLCVSDGSFPLPNGSCPHPSVPIGSSDKIHVYLKNNPLENVENGTNVEKSIDSWNVNASHEVSLIKDVPSKPITYLAIASVFILVFMIIVLYTISVKIRKKKAAARALMLKKNIFHTDRFISNPQYAVVSTERETSYSHVHLPTELIPNISRNSIDELEEIGEGFFGKVYKGLLHTVSNGVTNVETVAIKTLKGMAGPEIEQDFMREVEITSSFNHANILTLIGVCLRENDNPPWMIFEYMPYGDLTNVLRNGSNESQKSALPSLTLASLLSISVQIAEGMEYLASQHFVHRDLACRNCLVGSNLVVKIADFGMSRDVYTCDYYKIGGTRMLPVRWMSPESILFGKFTLESDVWSYGVVLWEIYNYGKQPYFGYTNEQVLQLVLDHVLLDIPKNCPSDVVDIIRGCWEIDPKNRSNFLDICNTLSRLLTEVEGNSSVTTLPRPPPELVTLSMRTISKQDRSLETGNSLNILTDDVLDAENYLKPSSPATQTITAIT